MAPSRALQLGLPRDVLCAGCTRRLLVHHRSFVASASLWSSESRLPRIASPSFWSSLIPRFLRRPTDAHEAATRAKRRDAGSDERRVGITFLVLGILVGSNAINIISIRRDMLNFTRQTDAKLALLREVVQKVKNGEPVDVKKALGTGDPEQEKEWEQAVQELQDTDMLWEGRKKRDAKRAEKAEEQRLKDEARKRSMAAEPTKDSKGEQKTTTPKFLM